MQQTGKEIMDITEICKTKEEVVDNIVDIIQDITKQIKMDTAQIIIHNNPEWSNIPLGEIFSANYLDDPES